MNLLKRPFSFLIIAAVFCACETPVTFTEPQPADSKNLPGFIKPLRGQYASVDDQSILLISDSLIVRLYDEVYKVHKDHLGTRVILSGDTIIDPKTNERSLVKHEGDSLVSHIRYSDTLFQLDEDHVLRGFNGYYFLNSRYGKAWEVKKMSLAGGKLIIGTISEKEDLNNLKEQVDIPEDTLQTRTFTATKKQFKKFVRNQGFSDSETFIRTHR